MRLSLPRLGLENRETGAAASAPLIAAMAARADRVLRQTETPDSEGMFRYTTQREYNR